MRKIINVTTGKSYPSIRAAAKDCYLSPAAIQQCLRGDSKRAGDCEWRYADGKY